MTLRRFFTAYLLLSLPLLSHAFLAAGKSQIRRHFHASPIAFHPATCAQSMQDFFSRFTFGKFLARISQPTHHFFYFQEGPAEIFQALEDVCSVEAAEEEADPVMYAGDYFYLDLLHKDHLEVFDATLHARTVINLDGTENTHKKAQALTQKR